MAFYKIIKSCDTDITVRSLNVLAVRINNIEGKKMLLEIRQIVWLDMAQSSKLDVAQVLKLLFNF